MQILKTTKALCCTATLFSFSLFFAATTANAQCLTNSLTNPSFESPVVNTINGNNLVGSSWSGWT